MCGLFFDDDGDVGISIGDNLGVNSKGDTIVKIGDNFGVNTRTGKTNFIIGFDDEDDD